MKPPFEEVIMPRNAALPGWLGNAGWTMSSVGIGVVRTKDEVTGDRIASAPIDPGRLGRLGVYPVGHRIPRPEVSKSRS